MLWVYGVPLGIRSGHDAAYALLECAYGQIVGGSMPPIQRGTWGKPFFLRGEVEFSLTHTKTMAFCALGDCPVGIDAETIRPVRPRVPARTMNPAELAWMEAFSDQDEAFLRLWTAKEAWAKLTGRGLGGQPKAIVLDMEPEEPVGVEGKPASFVWRKTDGVLVTVCTAAPMETQWAILQSLPDQ